MALEDFDLPTAEVSLPNGTTFTVRGLALLDLAPLITRRRQAIEGFFVKFSKQGAKGKAGANSDIIGAATDLLSVAPELAGEVIACAADRPHLLAKIMILPITVQLEALEKIANLTFDAAGGPGNFFAALTRVLGGTTEFVTNLTQSRIGSSLSAGK